MTAMLTLGLGAGLRVDEALATTAREHVRVHPTDSQLWVIMLPDRTVPVRAEYVPALRDLCQRYPDGPLMGRFKRDSKDPMHQMRRSIEVPKYLPPMKVSRLRTTWMAAVLRSDVRISEFGLMAGTVSAKTLECLAPHLPIRADDDTYLRLGAGL